MKFAIFLVDSNVVNTYMLDLLVQIVSLGYLFIHIHRLYLKKKKYFKMYVVHSEAGYTRLFLNCT